MAGRHLREIFTAYGSRNDAAFRAAAEAIIGEEEAKKHTALATELRSRLDSSVPVSSVPPAWSPVPIDRESSLPLATVTMPDRPLGSVVLDEPARAGLASIVREVALWPQLDAAGVARRNRVLLHGPPGCGKTSAAAALAHELGWPLVTARVEGLISSYLGATAANLGQLFGYATTAPFVLFLDEFDSLGKARGDASDHGELRRVVNAILQQIDTFSGPSLIVAATNHADVLDAAMWRRFDVILELVLPSAHQVRLLLRQTLPAAAAEAAEGYVGQLVQLPHAATAFFTQTAKRLSILGSRSMPDESDVHAAALEVLARPWGVGGPPSGAGHRFVPCSCRSGGITDDICPDDCDEQICALPGCGASVRGGVLVEDHVDRRDG